NGCRGSREKHMRLATLDTASGPRAAVLAKDGYVDLHATDAQIPASVRQILEGGAAMLEAAGRAAKRPDAVRLEASKVRLGPPVVDPPKIVCLGLNYRDHAAESGSPIPREPILFSKYATALIGPERPIVLPPVSAEVDYEAELVIVVGKRGK